jgi:hypothetical protein
MTIYRTAERMNAVSESEVWLLYLSPDGESTIRIISEWHKIM